MRSFAAGSSLDSINKAAMTDGRTTVFVCAALLTFVAGAFFSTVLISVGGAFLICFWLLTQRYRYLQESFKSRPFLLVGIALFLCFAVAALYSTAPRELAISDLQKYRKFLYLPVLMCFTREEYYRRWLWRGFMVASIVTVLYSDLKGAGIINLNPHLSTATIKNRISHSLFVAFFAFYCLVKGSAPGKHRIYYLFLSLLSLHNLFFVVNGRTGQSLFICLIALFTYLNCSKKQFILAMVSLALVTGLFIKFSDKAQRINSGLSSFSHLFYDVNSSSRDIDMEIRFALWRYSAQIMSEQPIIGFGTGSFSPELNRMAPHEKKLSNFDHPHNEFFKVGVETGLIGLAIYLLFYFALASQVGRLSPENSVLGSGVVIALAVVSLFNTPIYDHAQGNWFVMLIASIFAPKTQSMTGLDANA